MSSTMETKPGRLAVGARHVGRRVVLDVAGEIDMSTCAVLVGALSAATDDGAVEVWVDLTEVGFMDSTGVHVLLAARERLAGLNRRLAVICPPGPARRVIDVLGVEEALAVTPTRWSAHHAS